MDFRDKVFGAGERVMVDDNRFFGCTFDEGCIIEYNGFGAPQHFERCRFHVNVVWEFGENAAKVVGFLRFIAAVPQMRHVVGNWIDHPNPNLTVTE